VTDALDGRIGEAWAGESPDGCHVNVVLAVRASSTAAAAVGALANPSPGHTPFLVCLGPGNVVRPPTIFVNKTTIDDEAIGRLTWGAAQLGVGQGVLDLVDDGLLPADDVVVLAVVWIDPEAGDETALKRSCREAMRIAIADALQPADAKELAARREDATNGFYSGD
jgi:5,6,7,8-tetrahydromethanopterin hydro-lyase